MQAVKDRTSAQATTRATWCALAGGMVWAVTPLRDRLIGAGSEPEDGVLAFRLYNLAIVLAIVSLSVALAVWLRRTQRTGPSLVWSAGVVQLGHAMLVAGSACAVVLGDRAGTVTSAGQDLGFLGAMVAALGALPLGVAALRQSALPRGTALLFACTLPVGILGLVLLSAAGVPQDLLGLPLTILYGSAFATLGLSWRSGARPQPVGGA